MYMNHKSNYCDKRLYRVVQIKDTYFQINIIPKLIKVNGFRKHSLVRLSRLHLKLAIPQLIGWKVSKACFQIQNHLVEGSSNKIESEFKYLIRKHSIFLFLMYAANLRFFDMSSISLKTDLHPSSHSRHNLFK